MLTAPLPIRGTLAGFLIKYLLPSGESMSELIKISISDEALRAALGRLIAALTDTIPTMRDLSEIMIDASAAPLTTRRTRPRASRGNRCRRPASASEPIKAAPSPTCCKTVDCSLAVLPAHRDRGPSGKSARTTLLSARMSPMPPSISSAAPSNVKPRP